MQKVYLQIHLQGSVEGRTEQREKLTHNVVASEASEERALKLEWPFRTIPNDQQETGTLYTNMS